jgi:ribosomal subunit interface protein
MIRQTFSADEAISTPKLKKYCSSKIKDLEKYIPRFARESAHIDARFELEAEGRKKFCRLSLTLPEATLVAHESADHVYSALDIASAELKRQLTDYKMRHSKQSLRSRLKRNQTE